MIFFLNAHTVDYSIYTGKKKYIQVKYGHENNSKDTILQLKYHIYRSQKSTVMVLFIWLTL